MEVDVTVNIDIEMIERRTPKADHILAIQAKKDTEPFAPALTKSLANRSGRESALTHMRQRTKVVKGAIVYPGPYAKYLYYGKLMVDPDTRSAWAKRGAKKTVKDKNLVFTTAVHPDAQDHWFEASKAVNMDKWLRVYGKAIDSDN